MQDFDQTSLQFFGHRILLADTNAPYFDNIVLALQFLDYPLLLLRASEHLQTHTAATDVTTIQAGKSCVLSADDSQEAVHLAQQVPCSLLLLDVQHSTPQLVAAGAVAVQLQHPCRLPNSSTKQVVILRNQEQQPVACAEVQVCLQTPYWNPNSTEGGAATGLGGCGNHAQPYSTSAGLLQDSRQPWPDATLPQLQQAAGQHIHGQQAPDSSIWPAQYVMQQLARNAAPAGQPIACCHHLSSCSRMHGLLSHQYDCSSPTQVLTDQHGAFLDQQVQQQQIGPAQQQLGSPDRPAVFPAVLQHRQLAPGPCQHSPAGQHSQAADAEPHSADFSREVHFGSTEQQQVLQQRDVSPPADRSPSPRKRQDAVAAMRPGSSRQSSPSKLTAAKVAAAARTQQMQEQLRQLKARMTAQHKQQPNGGSRQTSPMRGGYRASIQQQKLQQRGGTGAVVGLEDVQCEVGGHGDENRVCQHSKASSAAARALQLLSGCSNTAEQAYTQQGHTHQRQQQQQHTHQQQQQGTGAVSAAAAAAAASNSSGISTSCVHCQGMPTKGAVQSQQQQQQQGPGVCTECSHCSHACCAVPGQHQHQHGQLQQVQPPTMHQGYADPTQQQQHRQERWQGGVSAATSVVWELLTLMSVRAVMSQAVTGLTDQLSGAMRGMLQQACLQQGLGLGLTHPWQSLNASDAAGSPAAAAAKSQQTVAGSTQAPPPAAAGGGGLPGTGWAPPLPQWPPAAGYPTPWGGWPYPLNTAATAAAAANTPAAAAAGPKQDTTEQTDGPAQQQQQLQQGDAQLTADQLQAQQEELMQYFQELEGLMVIRAEHSSSSSSSGSTGSGYSRRNSAGAVESLATGMAVTLRRSTRKRPSATGEASLAQQPQQQQQQGGSTASEAVRNSNGFTALPDVLQPKAGKGASAFAAAATEADNSRPGSPQGHGVSAGALSGSGSAASLLTGRPSSRLPAHLPPLPRAMSGNSAAGAASAASTAAAAVGAGGSASGGPWHMLGSRSSSGLLLQRGAVTACGAGVEGLQGVQSAAPAGAAAAMEIMLPLRKSSLRPLKQASSHISDAYEDDFEPASSTAPASPSILSPTSPPGTAAAVAAAVASGSMTGYTCSRQVGSAAAISSSSGQSQLQQQATSKSTSVVAKAGAAKGQAGLQTGFKRLTSAGAGDRDLPEIQEDEESDVAAEHSKSETASGNAGRSSHPGQATKQGGAPSWQQVLRGVHEGAGGQNQTSGSSNGVQLRRQSSGAQQQAASSWRGGVQFEEIADLCLPVVIQRSDSYADSFASAAEVASEHSVGSSVSSAGAGKGSGVQQYVPSFATAQQRGGGVATMSAVLPSNVRQRTPTPRFPAAAPTAAASRAPAPGSQHSYHSSGVLSQQQSLSQEGSSGGSYDTSMDGGVSESAAAGNTSQQIFQQPQQQRLSSNAASLDSELSDLLAELSASRASRMGSKKEAPAPYTGAGTGAAAAPAAVPGSSTAARAAAAAAVGLLSGRGAASITHQPQQQLQQQQASAGGRRLSSYSDVSLFSDDDEALAGGRAKNTSAGAAGAGFQSGYSSATAGKVGVSTSGPAGGPSQLRGARVSGDSRYSSFSMDESDIDIDYDELASLGIDINAPAPASASASGQVVAAGNSRPQQLQQQQLRPVTAHGLSAGAGAAGYDKQQQGPQRPGTSYGLPPKPQQYQQQQQQQQYWVNRQPGAGRAVSAGFTVGATGSAGVYEQHAPAKANAASVFYGHVSEAPMSTSSNAGRSVSRGC